MDDPKQPKSVFSSVFPHNTQLTRQSHDYLPITVRLRYAVAHLMIVCLFISDELISVKYSAYIAFGVRRHEYVY